MAFQGSNLHWKMPSGIWFYEFSIFTPFSEGYSLLRGAKICPAQNVMQFEWIENGFNINPMVHFVSKTNIVIMSYDRINVCSIFRCLEPSMLRENWFGSKFPELWIMKTCSKLQYMLKNVFWIMILGNLNICSIFRRL